MWSDVWAVKIMEKELGIHSKCSSHWCKLLRAMCYNWELMHPVELGGISEDGQSDCENR